MDNKIVIGAEGIIIHNNNIILGMQKEKRWYQLDDGSRGAIIKTIGGSLETEDQGDRKEALIREIIEEISNIKRENIDVLDKKIFSKTISMGELNPFDSRNKLLMNADFYFVNIQKDKIIPRDLPLLVEIPINIFLKYKLNTILDIKEIEKYIILNDQNSFKLPKYFSFFIPLEVINYLSDYEKQNF